MDQNATKRLGYIKQYCTEKQLINTSVHICSIKGLQFFELFFKLYFSAAVYEIKDCNEEKSHKVLQTRLIEKTSAFFN